VGPVTDADSAVRGKVASRNSAGPFWPARDARRSTACRVALFPSCRAATQSSCPTSRDEQKHARRSAPSIQLSALYQDVGAGGQLFIANCSTWSRCQALTFGASGRRYNRISAAFWNAVHAVPPGMPRPPRARGAGHRLLRISRGGLVSTRWDAGGGSKAGAIALAWAFAAPTLIALALTAGWAAIRTVWLGLPDADLSATAGSVHRL
jgi:hypothetical protein